MVAYGWSDVSLDHGFHAYRQMTRWTISRPLVSRSWTGCWRRTTAGRPPRLQGAWGPRPPRPTPRMTSIPTPRRMRHDRHRPVWQRAAARTVRVAGGPRRDRVGGAGEPDVDPVPELLGPLYGDTEVLPVSPHVAYLVGRPRPAAAHRRARPGRGRARGGRRRGRCSRCRR